MSIVFEKNLSAYKFNEALTPKIHSICQPLFNNFPIIHFAHIRIFSDKRMLRFSSSEKWTHQLFMNQYYNDFDVFNVSKIPVNEKQIFILTGPAPDASLCVHKRALFEEGVWNNLLIYERFEGYADFWFFGAKRDNTEILNLYMNHKDIFYKFNMYFKDKAKDWILTSNKSAFIKADKDHFQPQKLENNQNIDCFMNNTKILRYYLNKGNSNFYLSKREAECFLYLSQGKTVKEIGILTNLSSRTIEFYINNIKLKAGLYNKHNLIKAFPELRKVSFINFKRSGK